MRAFVVVLLLGLAIWFALDESTLLAVVLAVSALIVILRAPR
jgi:hypothetical protein